MKPMRALALRYARMRFGQTPEPMQLWAEHGGVFWSFAAEEMVVERTFRALPTAVRHLATLKAASSMDCPWCLDFGSNLAAGEGLTEDKLRDLHRWRESAAYDDDERMALEYAEQMTATPVVVDEALKARLRDRFGVKGLVELTAIVALENQRSRFNKAMGVLPQGWSRVCALPTPADAAVHG